MGFFWNGKITQKNGKNKDVIHAEGKFDHVAGQKLHGGGGAKGENNEPSEGKGESDPTRGGLEGATKVNRAWIPMEENEVSREKGEDKGSE